MNGQYILDAEGNPQPEPDPIKWAKWCGKAERHVAITEIGHTTISTVFLGLDHNWGEGPPLLWETLVFGGKFDGEMERWSTLEDAKNGHNAMVGKVTRDALPRVRGWGLKGNEH
jgi:hypothetical protein